MKTCDSLSTMNTKSTVVKSNSLLEARYTLTAPEQLLVLLAVAQIDAPREYSRDTLFNIPIADFEEIAHTRGLVLKDARRHLVGAIKKIMQRQIEIREGDRFKTVQWVNMMEYALGDSFITVEFNPYTLQLLTQIKKNFTQYQLQHVISFKHRHSFRFYEWMCRYKDVGHCILSLDEIRQRLQLPKSYQTINNLRFHVIKPALDEINAQTDLDITHQVKKSGRTVTALEFTISKKPEKKKGSSKSEPQKPKLESDQLSPEEHERQMRYMESLKFGG